MAQLRQRFAAKVDHRGSDECWPWTASKNAAGYGQIQTGSLTDGTRKPKLAHRVAWELDHGCEPDGIVMHICDNPACCNPAHLISATQADNLADMRAKKRHNFGGRNGRARLSSENVLEIRSRAEEGESQRAIARRFGIAQSHVSDIHRRVRWGWLEN